LYFAVASDDSSYITVRFHYLKVFMMIEVLTAYSRYVASIRSFPGLSQGTDFAVDGGLSSCYVTAEGEPTLAPPESLAPQHMPEFGQK
jgi:hypothetical protein